MKRAIVVGGLFALFVLNAPLMAQYGKYDWAMGLHRNFGFDDMAEKILTSMTKDPGHTPTEQLQGQLGLAELRAAQARSSSNATERVALLSEAAGLMKKAVDGWQNKEEGAYFDAIFSLVGVYQENGEAALAAVKDGGVSADEAQKLKNVAIAAFGNAQQYLEKNIRGKFEDADVDTDREKWRLKNRAWYLRCELLYSEAKAHKRNSPPYHIKLSEAQDELENFILNNDIEDSEAWVGSMYGTILMGQVLAAKESHGEAMGYLTSVLDQVGVAPGWAEKMHPLVQALVERAAYALFDYTNERGDYAATIKWGGELEANYKKAGMTFKKLGRAARVLLANAYFRSGETNAALAIAAQVTETGRGDPSGVLANRLIAEIIAVTPDKRQFSASIIKSAADGAWSQGRENWAEAVRYYRILMDTLGSVENLEERKAMEADAWFKIGYFAYDAERWLEAGLAFEEGTRRCKDVEKDGLNGKLADYWARSIRKAGAETGSPKIAKMLDDQRDYVAKEAIGSKSPTDIAWDQAQNAENDAKKAESAKNYAGARAKYDEAAGHYAKVASAPNRYQERAMAKQSRCLLKQAKLYESEKNTTQSVALLKKAKASFHEYLQYAKDPTNALTDPQYVAAREAAMAEARYSIADTNVGLVSTATSDDEKKKLLRESVAVLENFETDYPSQTSLLIFALYRRLDCHMDLGEVAKAEADYEVMKKVNPSHKFTAIGGAGLAKSLRSKAEDVWDVLVGKNFRPWDATAEEIAKVEAKAGYAEARANLLHAYQLYRDYLFSSKDAQGKFDNWNAIGYYFYKIGEWETCADIYTKALETFEGKEPAEELHKVRGRLLNANYQLAKAAQAAGDNDAAARLWHECGRLVDAVRAFKKTISVERLAAEIYGGYVAKNKAGFLEPVTALGRYDDAVSIWRMLHERAKKSSNGGDEVWEAKFYHFYTLYKSRRANNQTTDDIRKDLDRLRVVNPELGGPKWKPLFEWFDRLAKSNG